MRETWHSLLIDKQITPSVVELRSSLSKEEEATNLQDTEFSFPTCLEDEMEQSVVTEQFKGL